MFGVRILLLQRRLFVCIIALILGFHDHQKKQHVIKEHIKLLAGHSDPP